MPMLSQVPQSCTSITKLLSYAGQPYIADSTAAEMLPGRLAAANVHLGLHVIPVQNSHQQLCTRA